MNAKIKNGERRTGRPCMECPFRLKVFSQVKRSGNVIKIPFLPEFKKDLLSGRKTATTRSKKYGDPGDLFEIYGGTFLIQEIHKIDLEYVAEFLFYEEGLNSPNDFIEIWNRIHPRRKYIPSDLRFVHYFARVG